MRSEPSRRGGALEPAPSWSLLASPSDRCCNAGSSCAPTTRGARNLALLRIAQGRFRGLFLAKVASERAPRRALCGKRAAPRAWVEIAMRGMSLAASDRAPRRCRTWFDSDYADAWATIARVRGSRQARDSRRTGTVRGQALVRRMSESARWRRRRAPRFDTARAPGARVNSKPRLARPLSMAAGPRCRQSAHCPAITPSAIPLRRSVSKSCAPPSRARWADRRRPRITVSGGLVTAT